MREISPGFNYDSLSDLRAEVKERGYFVPTGGELDALFQPGSINGGLTAPNRLCVNPMEGGDADADGGPSTLTFRRYKRYAEGGAGIIWVEATAVTEGGKGRPRQLHLNEESVESFSQLVDLIKKSSRFANVEPGGPVAVIQLTHSGRQSAPRGRPEPVIARHSDLLEDNSNLSRDYPVISDAELGELKQDFVRAAGLAARAGFDAVDVKACHGYLLHELLTAYESRNSRYRGEFTRRTKFLLDVLEEIKKEFPKITLASRLDLYDNIPYPDGWGVSRDGGIEPDLTEPKRLLSTMEKSGLKMVNVAFGNGYYDPFLERPYDRSTAGGDTPQYSPLEAISTNLKLTAEIGESFPHLFKVGGGISWLREFSPYVAAAMRGGGWVDGIGLARIALANPDFANELYREGELQGDRLCVTCSCCTQMLEDYVEAGCPVYDGDMYRETYLKGRRRGKGSK